MSEPLRACFPRCEVGRSARWCIQDVYTLPGWRTASTQQVLAMSAPSSLQKRETEVQLSLAGEVPANWQAQYGQFPPGFANTTEGDAAAKACQRHRPQQKGPDPRGTHAQQYSLRPQGRLQAPELSRMNWPQNRWRDEGSMSLPPLSVLLTCCVPARGPHPNPRRSGAHEQAESF